MAIATALVNRPEVLFVDEPAAGLDDGDGRAVMDIIEGLHGKLAPTVVVATQNRGHVRYATRAFQMAAGRVEEMALPSPQWVEAPGSDPLGSDPLAAKAWLTSRPQTDHFPLPRRST